MCSTPPSISIVIPCYQAEDTLAAAIASSLDQTLPALEVIVCDDGSTDGTRAVLAPFLEQVVYAYKENGGAASARNHGTRLAKGDFVTVLDADDTYDRRRVEVLVALASENPLADIVTTDAWVEKDGARIGRLFELNEFALKEQRTAILKTNFVGAWPAIRRTRILDVGGYDESEPIAHDWDLHLRLILSGSVALRADEPLLTYRRHSKGLTGDPLAAHTAAVRMLSKHRQDEHLSAAERDVLQASINRKRRRLASERIALEIEQSAREALLRSAFDRDAPWRARGAAVRGALRRG